MKYLSVSKVNPKVVEQLEEAHSRVRFEEPSFTHQEQLKEYVGSMRQVDDTMRESKVIQWVTPMLEQALNLWRTKYSQNSELLNDAQKEKIELENARKQNKTSIGIGDDKLESLQKKLTDKEDEINLIKQDGLKNERIDLGSERLKMSVLLIFAIVVALGTSVYFANSQVAVYWGTMSNAEKVAEVKTLILDGARSQFSAFADVIDLPEGSSREDLSLDDLAAINVLNVYKAPKPTLMQYFSADFSRVFLAVGALLLIMMGKLTAIVYEKMGEPNWMYFLIFILATGVLIGSIYSRMSISSTELQLTIISDKVQAIDGEIKKIEKSSSRYSRSVRSEHKENPKILPLKEEKKKFLIEHGVIQESFRIFQFITGILIMFTEVLIGSLAWIGHDEYIKKRMSVRVGSEGRLHLATAERDGIVVNIDKLQNDMVGLESVNQIATDLIHRLNAMLSDIISKEKVDQLAQNYMDRELAFAEQILQKARSEKL